MTNRSSSPRLLAALILPAFPHPKNQRSSHLPVSPFHPFPGGSPPPPPHKVVSPSPLSIKKPPISPSTPPHFLKLPKIILFPSFQPTSPTHEPRPIPTHLFPPSPLPQFFYRNSIQSANHDDKKSQVEVPVPSTLFSLNLSKLSLFAFKISVCLISPPPERKLYSARYIPPVATSHRCSVSRFLLFFLNEQRNGHWESEIPIFYLFGGKDSFSVLEIWFILEQYFSCRFVARLSIPLLFSFSFSFSFTLVIPSTPFLRQLESTPPPTFPSSPFVNPSPPLHRFKSFVSNTRA